ncbi:MAG: divalent cation tolerance protein CutA [Rhodospirillaceae bacterium]|jgi:uncharacterized protein involved in tolerance to divalent cations|nr:divalent cation tolerance protein CutA [Rhodospirillaceae bacterium]
MYSGMIYATTSRPTEVRSIVKERVSKASVVCEHAIDTATLVYRWDVEVEEYPETVMIVEISVNRWNDTKASCENLIRKKHFVWWRTI